MLTINLGVALCVYSLYCMAAGFVATALGARQEIFLPIFFASVLGSVIGAAMHKLPRGVRLVAIAPVLACAFLCKSIPEYALLAIPVIIIAVTQLTGKYSRDYHDFKSLYFKLLPVVIVMLLILLFFEYMGDLGIYFTLIYIVGGILTLRMLRQDAEVYNSVRFTVVNSLPLLLFAAVMVALGSGDLLSKALSGVGWLLSMIGKGILLLFGGLAYLFMLLFGKEEELLDMGEAEASESPSPTGAIKPVEWKHTIGESKDLTALLIAIAAIIIIIFAVIIVLYIIRHNKNIKGSGSGRSLEKRSRYRGAGGGSSLGTAKVSVPKSSQGIRSTYKKWLKLLKKRRVVIARSDTSLDVLDKRAPQEVPYEQHKTLRELYVKARYIDGYAATHEEQKLAKEAYEKLAESEFTVFHEKHE